jgi:hypothetical protein
MLVVPICPAMFPEGFRSLELLVGIIAPVGHCQADTEARRDSRKEPITPSFLSFDSLECMLCVDP